MDALVIGSDGGATAYFGEHIFDDVVPMSSGKHLEGLEFSAIRIYVGWHVDVMEER